MGTDVIGQLVVVGQGNLADGADELFCSILISHW